MAVSKMLEEKLKSVKKTLATAEKYEHAANVLMYDQETICPADAMEEQGEVWAFLNNQSYKLIKDPSFIEAAEYLYEHRSELEELDRVVVFLGERQGLFYMLQFLFQCRVCHSVVSLSVQPSRA